MATLSTSLLRGPAPSDATPATTASGILSGLLLAGAYAALELLLTGPLNAILNPERLVGAWYLGAVCIYFGFYLIFGALAGAAAGSLFALAQRPAHQVSLVLAATLTILFAANSLKWERTVFNSPFLIVVFPFAVWLLAGLLHPRPDPSRTLAASPWFTALFLLGPIWLSRELLAGQPLLLRLLCSLALVVLLAVTAHAARRAPSLLALASVRTHGAFIALVFLASFVMLRGLEESPVAAMPQSSAPAVSRPNLILISLDTVRADHLSVYGYSRPTSPNLERFAARATLYRHAYANGDFTLPSHASMLTGRYPAQHGALGDMAGYHPISLNVPTLPEVLKKAGYFTAAVVANHGYLNRTFGFHRGFDRLTAPAPIPAVGGASDYALRSGLCALTLPWVWTEALRSYLPAGEIAALGESEMGRANGKPFFLFLNLMDAHRPWVSRGRFRNMFPGYDQRIVRLDAREGFRDVLRGTRTVSDAERLKMHAAYDGGIAYADDALGRLLDRLRQHSWYDESLIIITADHGDQFGRDQLIDHGNSLNQGATRVPFVVKFPGQSQGRVVDSPVSLVDVFSTLAAAAGAPAHPQEAGANLALGDPGRDRTIILESYPVRHFAIGNPRLQRVERAAVQGHWKLIQSDRGRRDLFDIMADPGESTNLWSEHLDVAQTLEHQLREWTAQLPKHRRAVTPPAADPERLRNLKALGYAQ